MIHHGDCLEVMAGLDADSIDAIVTDPPYGIGFMGKAWDETSRLASFAPSAIANPGAYPKTGKGPAAVAFDGRAFQAWCEAWATEALRIAKPGAHLLAFGGTRTYHRLACAIEDAGWEVRDCLVWAYASGFPKSHNLKGEWQGWGTALKPAWEPIVMARKPLRGTVAANVARYGTGALNIDACRIGTTKDVPASPKRSRSNGIYSDLNAMDGTSGGFDPNLGRWPANLILTDPIFDGDTPDVVGGGWQEGGGNPAFVKGERISDGVTMGGGWRDMETGQTPVDTAGTYSRFFLVPKADRADREPVLGGLPKARAGALNMRTDAHSERSGNLTAQRANVHPTVKPTELMRHLVRLVTPPGGLVLDPFLGSGTTALACEMEGFPWVGIEREAEYVAIAEARLNGTQRGLGLEERA